MLGILVLFTKMIADAYEIVAGKVFCAPTGIEVEYFEIPRSKKEFQGVAQSLPALGKCAGHYFGKKFFVFRMQFMRSARNETNHGGLDFGRWAESAAWHDQ